MTSPLSPARRLVLGPWHLGAGAAAQAQQVFRVTAIPDESPTELARKAAPLVKYLEQQSGHEGGIHAGDRLRRRRGGAGQQAGGPGLVRRLHLRAGAASVRAARSLPLVQREEDEKFRSVFITTDAGIKTLADLKGRNVSFGSQSSTSGHLMPRSFLLAAGIDPDTRLQARRLLGRARRHRRRGRLRQGRRRRAEHLGVGKAGGRQEGRSRQGARVLHHADLLRLQLDGARRHAAARRDKLGAGLHRT